MAKFTYKEKRVMPKRPGKTYSTVYIKQELAERERMKKFVEEVCKEVEKFAKENNCEELLENPLNNPRHRHENGKRYTVGESLKDMKKQLDLGNDLTESIFTRWNEACREYKDWQIELEQATPRGNSKPPIQTTFNSLFV